MFIFYNKKNVDVSKLENQQLSEQDSNIEIPKE